MTSIGSTSYANSTGYYSGTSKSNVPASEADTPKHKSVNGSHSESAPAFDSRPSNATLSFQGKLLIQGPIAHGVDLKPMNISELPDAEYKAFMEGEQLRIEANERFLQLQYSNHDEMLDLSNYAGTKPYATVTVGGRVVATIDNQGVMTTSEALADKLRGKLPEGGTAGPNLAQEIADAIAKFLGGRVDKASTALSQSEFNAIPSPEKDVKIDYDAMMRDPMYSQLQRASENYAKIEQQRAEYIAKQQGAGASPA